MLRNNLRRAELACQWIMVSMVINFLGALLYLYQMSTAESLMDAFISAVHEGTFVFSQVWTLISLAVTVGVAISFIQWFRRAYHNSYQVEKTNRIHGEDMATVGWFLPFANLIIPYRIMQDLWSVGLKHAALETNDRLELERVRGLIGVWWALWVLIWVMPVVLLVIAVFHEKSTLLLDSVFWLVPTIIRVILILASGCLLLHLITSYRKIEEGLERAIENGELIISQKNDSGLI